MYFLPPSLLIGNVWVLVMHFLRVAYTAKCIGEWAGGKDRSDCISAAFDMVNHQGILYMLCSVGIGGAVLSIVTQFLSDRSQHVMVDS